MNNRIIIDDLSSINKRYHRILECEPEMYYERAETLSWFSYYKRHNSVFSETIFPQPDKTKCACGCSKKLSGRQRRWATDDCKIFSNQVIRILMGDAESIKRILNELYDYVCTECKRSNNDFKSMLYPPNRKEYSDIEKFHKDYDRWIHEQSSKIHLDHIIPVHQGGGACWLSNYQFLCVECHKKKTKQERK